MSERLLFFAYAALMLSLAILVRWEFTRRRKGLNIKHDIANTVDGPPIPYSPPPDRSNRSFERRAR
jgi:hypothetical protein